MIDLLKRACVPLAAATITAAIAATGAAGASHKTTISFTLGSRGTAGTTYRTQRGLTHTYPGKLQTGDQIFSQDTLLDGTKEIGYGNEVCTVTFDGNDLCNTVAVFPGKGEVYTTWLWIGRNNSYLGPRHFGGVINGGTGMYTNATGHFDATVDSNGTLQFTATLNRG
jgi:hypothetical protein